MFKYIFSTFLGTGGWQCEEHPLTHNIGRVSPCSLGATRGNVLGKGPFGRLGLPCPVCPSNVGKANSTPCVGPSVLGPPAQVPLAANHRAPKDPWSVVPQPCPSMGMLNKLPRVLNLMGGHDSPSPGGLCPASQRRWGLTVSSVPSCPWRKNAL